MKDYLAYQNIVNFKQNRKNGRIEKCEILYVKYCRVFPLGLQESPDIHTLHRDISAIFTTGIHLQYCTSTTTTTLYVMLSATTARSSATSATYI